MDVSVVVPTYNQSGPLQRCLRALLDQDLPSETYEVIVVDDGSTDDTQAQVSVQQRDHPRLVLTRLSRNRGRSAARNAGVARARGTYVVFVDSDILVRRDFLGEHLRLHRRHGPRVLSRGPVVLVATPEAAAAARIPWLFASPAFLDTANAGVSRATLVEAGLFDEAFPGYGWEDFELGLRLQRLGIRRVFSRAAAAFHVQPPPPLEAMPEMLRKEEERARSAAYFYRKHPSAQTRWLIQATPVHEAAFWCLAGFGTVSKRNVARVVARLRRAAMPGLAFLALRGVLHQHYLQGLRREMGRDADLG